MLTTDTKYWLSCVMTIYHTTSILQIAGYTLPYDEISEVRERLGEIAPNLLQYDDLQPANFFALAEKLMKVQKG